MEYFEVVDVLSHPKKRWFLGIANFDDEWEFWKYVRAGKVEVPDKELVISVRRKGIPLDFTMGDFQLLIVNEKVRKLIGEEGVQYIPVKIKGVSNGILYFIMVVNNDVECIDENKSVFDKYLKDDPIRPDKAGQYRSIYKTIIDPNKVIGNEIFRIKYFNVIIIVSERIKNLFEENNISGVSFKKVTE